MDAPGKWLTISYKMVGLKLLKVEFYMFFYVFYVRLDRFERARTFL